MTDHKHDFQPEAKSGIRICTHPNCCEVERAKHRCEAPAEGAGERVKGATELQAELDQLANEYGDLLTEVEALRARSSAPEAREVRTHPTGEAIQDAVIAGFLHGVGMGPWDDMHDYIAVCARDYAMGEPLPVRTAAPSADKLRIAGEALEPFAAFARVAEAKSRMALGKVLPDNEVIASISWEGGLGVLVMGHLRDALSMAPDAKGWGGLYRRSESLAALKAEGA